MKLNRLHINHFGKLENTTLTFGNGIHVISGDNESGKSTLHAFLRAMFFGVERSRGRGARTDAFNRYQPWNGGTYGGVLELERQGNRYSIYRAFDKNTHPCRLADETHARELEPTAENFSSLLCGLTPSLYNNTVSVGQLKAGTDADLADELRNHIINLRTSGSANLDVTAAISLLGQEKKKLANRFSREADQEQAELELRIETMAKDLQSGNAEQTVSRLESEKAALERRIIRLGDHHQQVASTMKRGENTLHRYRFHSAAEADTLLNEVNELEKNAARYEKQYRFPIRGVLRPLAGLLSLLLFAFFLFAFFRSSMQLLHHAYLPAGLYFLAAMVSGLCGLRLNRWRSAAATHRKIDRRLQKIWDSHFEDSDETGVEYISELKEKLTGCRDLFHTIEQSRDSLKDDMDKLLAAQNESKKISDQLEQARHLSWQTEQKEEALRALEERREMLRETIESNRSILEETEAIQLAIDTLQELSTNMYDSFGYFLGGTTSELLHGITGGAYTGVFIDSDLSISLEQNDRRVSLHQVSSGTIDQVYLALRLACIEFLWPDESMPLFLDDTFALYDRDRLSCTLQWLAENYTGQIFLFTCQSREEELLEERKIPHQKIVL